MDAHEFWNLLDRCRPRVRLAWKRRYVQKLERQLSTLAKQDIIGFQRHLDQRLFEAYTWDLWAAAYLINGGCSDDGFEYFRAWVVSMGRDFYETTVSNPDSLAQRRLGSDLEFEEFLSTAFVVFEGRFQDEDLYEAIAPNPALSADPAGTGWDEGDLESLRRRLPKLCNRYLG